MKLGYDGNYTDVDPDTVEEGGERRTVIRNYTNDRIAILQRKKTLSTQEAAAGRALQRLREQAVIGGVKAQEHMRVFQDRDVVKGKDNNIAAYAAQAFWKLERIREKMTPMHWDLVKAVAFDNMSNPQIVALYPRHSTRTIGPAISYAFEELTNVLGRIGA